MEHTNAWIYCRIDAPEDSHGALKGQYEQLERYAEQMGFTVVGSSQDTGGSTQTISTGLQTALDAAKAGAFSVLLVTSLSCLGHRRADRAAILYGLTWYGILIYSPLEGNVSARKGACR